MNTDEFDKALVEFQEVLGIESKHADAHAGIAEGHLRLGNLKEAENAAKKVPNHSSAQLTLARVIKEYREQGIKRMESGNYEGALSEFGAALRIDPNHEDTLLSSAAAYLGLHDLQEAENALEKVLKRNPRSRLAQGLMHSIRAESGPQNATTEPEAGDELIAEAEAYIATEAAEKDEEGGPSERFAFVALGLGLVLGLVSFMWFISALSFENWWDWISLVPFSWAFLFYKGLFDGVLDNRYEGIANSVHWTTIAFFWWVWCRISGKRE